MRTIKGRELSKTPVSISKAASILSNFVSTETGASHAIAAYLRRTSAAFGELAQLHKELKPDRKHKKKPKLEITEELSQHLPTQGPGELSEEKVSHEVKHKRKKKKDGGEVKIEEVKVRQGNGLSGEPSHEIKPDKIKKEKTEVDNLMNNGGQIGNFDGKVNGEAESAKERHKRKTKKDKDQNEISNFEENGAESEIAKEEKKKKRKSREVDGEGNENNSEGWPRKKKKRKSEGDS